MTQHITREDERAALEWLDLFTHGHADVIKAMLAEPRLPKEPSGAMIAAMLSGMDGWIDCATNRNYTRALYANLYAHLTKPATKIVQVWRVEWAERLTGDREWRPRSVGPFIEKRMAEGCAGDLAESKLNACIRVTGPHDQEVPNA